MSTLATLNIPLEKINYNRKNKRLTLKILDFTYIGHYEKKDTIEKLIDDLKELLEERDLERREIILFDKLNNKKLPIDLQFRDLEELMDRRIRSEDDLEGKGEQEYKKDLTKQVSKKSKAKAEKPRKKEEASFESLLDEAPEKGAGSVSLREATRYEEEEGEIPSPSAPSGAARVIKADESKVQEPIKEYDINLGLQYYSVMMEKTAYLFYVYFSYDVLEILDEEGKSIYKTKFKIKTRKKEPPILDLKIEGEGFEVHPLSGKVLVKKDSINPPVMVFSITPKKTKKKLLKKKEEQRNYLHIFINYEGQEVNHTVLSIIVQPKQFQIKLGPLRLNVSKTTAMVLSFLSVLIATLSAVYSVFSIQDSLNTSSSSLQILSDIAPGFGGFLLMAIYFVLIFKKSIYPLKEKWSDFINFDHGTPIMK